MSHRDRAYLPPGWLIGGHAQTIYPFLLRRRPDITYRRERIDTPDGDFIDFDWLDSTGGASANTPLVVLFHGLEGNSRSHYATALMQHLQILGWRGVVPHFRGCSGEPNRLPRAYHSGDYVEVGWMLGILRAAIRDAPLYVIGVSLGASALLNWLGREQYAARDIVTAATAVSAPLDLTAAGRAIGQGFNRLYAMHFLYTLKPKALAMAQRFPGLLDARALRKIDSMYAFDEIVTAPLHGFANADDYWVRASSKPWLRGIAVPTLVLNALNDPFVPPASLPCSKQVSRSVVLEQPPHGGHVGFLQTPFPGRMDWLPTHLLNFLADSR